MPRKTSEFGVMKLSKLLLLLQFMIISMFVMPKVGLGGIRFGDFELSLSSRSLFGKCSMVNCQQGPIYMISTSALTLFANSVNQSLKPQAISSGIVQRPLLAGTKSQTVWVYLFLTFMFSIQGSGLPVPSTTTTKATLPKL